MNLVLTRKWNTIDGIYGELNIYEMGVLLFSCKTVELPWKDNKKSISCIPTGIYACQRGYYYRGGYQTFEILSVPNRTEIKIHIANVPIDLEGCIGLGKSFGWVKGQYAVLRSGEALREFMKVMEDINSQDNVQLTILAEIPNYG